MKRYCISCGSPTEYSLKKPIFCSNCGKSFDKIQVNKVTQKPIAEKRTINPVIANNVDYEIDNELDDIIVPDISKIEIEIKSDNDIKNKGTKLGEIIGTAIPSEGEKKVRQKIKGKRNSKKQILEDFSKEAGTIKKNKDSK